ncbi:hypothetical protein BM525_19405 (plasmid) [Alteromonas mediterranea]|uniref:Uncharacterized protein n=1 Tax=Alteromonas mediterranea TaxID=314275 RepID=A0AAC9JGF1_9ALTE|nr:hypothetical protein [Alteromonas mediterranea]APD92051.1 hypothetical protein BM524_19210 [Alteromonas mediterranea]APD99905.1 hypothetical protein BM525_19405 [Alteromonas mediterranea]
MKGTLFFLPCAIAIESLTAEQREALLARCRALGADVYKGWYESFRSVMDDVIAEVNKPFNYRAQHAYLTIIRKDNRFFMYVKSNIEFAGQGGAIYDFESFMDMTHNVFDINALIYNAPAVTEA